MSHINNTALLERAADAVDLAHDHIEQWLSTPLETQLDEAVAQVMKHIETNNTEDLHYVSLPRLETLLEESAQALQEAEDVRAHFEAEYNPEEATEAAEILRDALREDGMPF